MPSSNIPLKTRAFELLRRGPDEVDWVPPGLGFGNHMYMWLYAWKRQQEGVKSRILLHDSMLPWLSVFPALEPLTVQRQRVKLTDRRVMVWGQEFGIDFTEEEIVGFINDCILGSQLVQRDVTAAARNVTPGTLTINVRRGDYYKVPDFFQKYGMNVKAYVETAASHAASQSSISNIRVVSDDPQWCRDNLVELQKYGPMDFGPENRTPMGDFASLIAAETLVLANSTFSYWAGHINSVIYPKGASSIWAPRFHARHRNNGRAWQLDPKWNIIENLPGGWEPSEVLPAN